MRVPSTRSRALEQKSLSSLPGGGSHEESQSTGGSKKGRAAFGDITNAGSSAGGGPSQQRHPFPEKEGEAVKSGSAGQGGSRPGALPPRHRRPQQQLQDTPFAGGASSEAAASQPERTFIDIDEADRLDIKASSEYAEDVVDSLSTSEVLRRPSPSYLTDRGQTDITANMRCVLVDWLVEVAQEFKLTSDTLHLAVAYIDRYLTLASVPRSRLQLLGVSCMLLAAKFEEIYAPQVQEFRYITDNSYTRAEILEMEESVLLVLKFAMAATTPRHFLRRFIKASLADMAFDPRMECMAAYILELGLPEYCMLQWLPSQLAAAAVMLARYTLTHASWSPTLVHYTRASAASLQDTASALHTLHVRAADRTTCSVPAIRDKYSNPRYKSVAQLMPPTSLPAWLFRAEAPVSSASACPPRGAGQLPYGAPASYELQRGGPFRDACPAPELSLSTSCEMSPATSYEASPAMD